MTTPSRAAAEGNDRERVSPTDSYRSPHEMGEVGVGAGREDESHA